MSIEKDWFINFEDVTSYKLTGDAISVARYNAGLFGDKRPGDENKERQGGGRGAAGGAKIVNDKGGVGGMKMSMFGSR